MSRMTPGTAFGPYRIAGSIARGARRTVYDARHQDRDERVALLVLSKGSPSESRRFQEDIRRVARLRHECLPTVLDSGEFDGAPFLATGFVEGDGLGAILRDGPPPPTWSAHVVVRLAHALARCHHAGINCHDLTPADIILAAGEPEPRPVLVGFALLSGDSKRLGAGSHPGFLAPEVHRLSRVERTVRVSTGPAEAEGRSLGPWTDVYSLGVTLYYLLAGRPPFGTGDRRQVIQDVLSAEPPDPRSFNPRVPRRMSEVCRQALAKPPEARQASAEGFARELAGSIGN